MLYDPWFEENVWTKTFSNGSKGWLVGRDEVAVMQPDGQFVILSLLDGTPKIDTMLEPEPLLKAIFVLPSRDQYTLITVSINLVEVAFHAGADGHAAQGRRRDHHSRTATPCPHHLDWCSH